LGILFTLAISWLSAILGLMVKSLEAAQWIGFVIIFPLTFMSSAFVPVKTMEGFVKTFAEHNPVTYVIDAMRSWLVGTPMNNADFYATIWCIGIIVVCAPLAVWMFRRRAS
jgi:ABC-2 type transport system permease protein